MVEGKSVKFISRLLRRRNYNSAFWCSSVQYPGVRYAVRTVSLQARIELVQQTRELAMRHEFLRAGDAVEQLEASLGDLLVRQLYLRWGLLAVQGLAIEGRSATPASLVEFGPEILADEIVESIKGQLCLTETERKNS